MHVFKHPKFYEEFRQRAKRCQKELKASLEKKSDSVISKPGSDGDRQACTGSGPQDNNASFEGISEAEYNKRHMKALKDAEPSGRKKRKKKRRKRRIK